MIKIGDDERPLTGIVACSNSMGAADAAIISSYLLSVYRFKVIILAGIAGGVTSKPNNTGPHLGDVVLSNAIIESNDVRTYSEKQFSNNNTGEMIVLRPKIYKVEYELKKFLTHFARDNSKLYLDFESDFSNHITRNFNTRTSILVGPYLTVNGVISSGILKNRLIEASFRQFPERIMAMEMEGYSIARSVQVLAPESSFIICKGINDYLDSNKNSDEGMWREIACSNSAKVAKQLLKSYLDASI